MAKLPGAEALGERPSPVLPRRTPMVAEYRPTSGFEEAPAQELAHAGGQFQEASVIALHAKEQQDSLRAEDAYTQLRKKQIDMTYGQGGFSNLKGGDAVNKPILKDYGAQFDQSAADIAGTLDNDFQKKLFQRRAEISGLQLRNDIVKHVASEQTVYRHDVLKGTIAVESQAASLNPAMVPMSATRIDHAIDVHAISEGKPKEWVEQAKVEAKSGMYSNIISQAVTQNDPAQALQLYRAYENNLTPNDRVVIGHRVNQAILPVQTKAIADYAIGGRDPAALPALQRVLDVGGEAAIQRVSQDLDASGQATPQGKRETRSMLGTWIADGEKLANAVRPNDPLFRDMVVQQIKGHVATIVAMQDGVQRQAQGTLLQLANGGPEGKQAKPTTLDQLFAQPGARDAYMQLDPQAARGISALIEHNATEAERGTPVRSNAKVVNDLFTRIHLADEDPRKISRPEQLTPYFAQGINRTDFEWLKRDVLENQSVGGRNFNTDVERVRTTAKAMMLRSISGQVFPDVAEESAYRFGLDVTQKIDEFRKAGKDPRTLLTPGSPDYTLDPKRVASYLPTGTQALAQAANTNRPKTDLPAAYNPQTKEWLILKEGKWQKP